MAKSFVLKRAFLEHLAGCALVAPVSVTLHDVLQDSSLLHALARGQQGVEFKVAEVLRMAGSWMAMQQSELYQQIHDGSVLPVWSPSYF